MCRRTMRGDVARPEGQLLGHTEGVTHVDARGDGRFLISNAKDSTIRLWDLRHMTPGNKVIPEQDLVRPSPPPPPSPPLLLSFCQSCQATP